MPTKHSKKRGFKKEEKERTYDPEKYYYDEKLKKWKLKRPWLEKARAARVLNATARREAKKKAELESDINFKIESVTSSLLPKPSRRGDKLEVPSPDKIIEALQNSMGLLSHAAIALQYPVESLKALIKKNKGLRSALLQIREANLDSVEWELMARIFAKKDPLLMMFYLKNQGMHRGWANERAKAGGSADKPLFIKILPVDSNGEPIKGKASIKEEVPEIKILPERAEKYTKEEQEFVDVEAID